MNILCSRFYRAVAVCAGDRPIKLRLTRAWTDHLDEILPGDLPATVRVEFEQLRNTMYSIEAMPGEHPARAAVRKMSAADASRHAHTLLRLYQQLIARTQETDMDELTSQVGSIPEQESSQQLN